MAAVRILHLHSSFNVGSQESRTVRLMNHFGDQAEHTVLSAVDDAFGAEGALDRRVKVNFPKDVAPCTQLQLAGDGRRYGAHFVYAQHEPAAADPS
jgi:hypothetical protein